MLLGDVKGVGIGGELVNIFLMVEGAGCWMLKDGVLDGWPKTAMRLFDAA